MTPVFVWINKTQTRTGERRIVHHELRTTNCESQIVRIISFEIVLKY